MTSPAKSSLRFDDASFIDPMARVFHHQGSVFRAIYPEHIDFFRKLMAMDRTKDFMAQSKLVPTFETDDIEVEGFGMVLEHHKVAAPNYCFEWPFSMLKDAALLTLELAQAYAGHGVLLQDADAYNIFYEDGRPMFIDFTSLVPETGDYLWAAYQQFCSFFLYPLYLHAAGKSHLALKLLRSSTRGLQASEIGQVLSLGQKMRLPGYRSRVAIPETFAGRSSKVQNRTKMAAVSAKLMDKIDAPATRARMLAKLARDVGKLSSPAEKGHWIDYYQQTDQGVLADKTKAVAKVLGERKPALVVDAGANLGEFSVLAAEAGARVISFDIDHDCINRLYLKAKTDGLAITPLVADLLDPSPALGWRNREYPALPQRVTGDMVMALALIHHLVFSGGQDFDRSVACLADYTQRDLLIEYVDPEDAMAQLLPRRPGVDYSFYTLEGLQESLSKFFSQVEVVEQFSPTRILLLASDPIPHN